MKNGLTGRALLEVGRVFRDGSLVGMPDRQILERFVESRDEMAFEAILARDGAMVRRVCKQMLFNPHDVDDAVQAVFLVFVRKARWIQIEGSLGPWLYSVAGRVAARARADRRKQWEREGSYSEQLEPSDCAPGEHFEVNRVIHDELGRLPERLRAPLVLCYLEGLTHDLAARELECPVGTVRSRLARGRDLLQRRITRRGLALSAAGLGGILESNASAAVCSHLPVSLVRSITSLAVGTVPSNGMGLITPLAMILEGVLNMLPIKKIAVLATAVSVGTIAFALVERTTAARRRNRNRNRRRASHSMALVRETDVGERISGLPRTRHAERPVRSGDRGETQGKGFGRARQHNAWRSGQVSSGLFAA